MAYTAAQLNEMKTLIKQSQTARIAIERESAVKALAQYATAEANTALINTLTDLDEFVQIAAIKILVNRIAVPRIYNAVEEVATGWQPCDWRAQAIASAAISAYWRVKMIAAC